MSGRRFRAMTPHRLGPRQSATLALAGVALLGTAGAWVIDRGAETQPPLPAGVVYIANLRSAEVVALAVPGGNVVDRTPLPSGPHELVETDGGELFATLYRGAAIARVAPTPLLLDLPRRPHGAAALAGDTLLLTLGDDDALAAFDTAGRELWRVGVGRTPHAVAVGNGPAYVANSADDTVSVVDLDLRRELTRYSVGATPESVAVGADGAVYVANAGSGTVSVIDPATDTVATVAVGGKPVRVVAPGPGPALAAVGGEGRLVALDRTGALWSIAIGPAPDGIAVDPTGRWAFVAENRSGTVSIVDLAGREVRARFYVGEGPSGLWFRPAITDRP